MLRNMDKPNFSVSKLIIGLVLGTVLTETIYYVIRHFSKIKMPERSNKLVKTIFFPDSQVGCRAQFTQRNGCSNQRCRFSHSSDNSYGQLLSIVNSARVSLDVCVFVITCRELADILIDLHNKGVIVRIITDSEQLHSSGSQIARFREAGIQVRLDSTSYLMHHKFAVIDNQTLLNGSFNWTRQAITGNHENLTITHSASVVQPYKEEFIKLWECFDPCQK